MQRYGEQNPSSKLREQDVRDIRTLYETQQYSKSELASMFRVSGCTIDNVITRRSWDHVDNPSHIVHKPIHNRRRRRAVEDQVHFSSPNTTQPHVPDNGPSDLYVWCATFRPLLSRRTFNTVMHNIKYSSIFQSMRTTEFTQELSKTGGGKLKHGYRMGDTTIRELRRVILEGK